jgi:simple sugar transport system permease protein
MTTVPAPQPAESQLMNTMRRLWRSVSVPLVAVLLGLIIGAILLIASGSNPLEAYSALLKGAFGSPVAIQRTLEKATPLIFSGLAVAFAFKAGLFNIGAQGQLLIGAVAAAYVGFSIEGLPAIIHAPLALFIGMERSLTD